MSFSYRATVWALVFLALATGRALAAPASPGRALIVYDTWHEKPDPTEGDALKLEQLLGHFPIEATVLGMDAYRTGMADRYRYFFVLGIHKDTVVPRALLDDARRYRGTLCWLNSGAEQLGRDFLQGLGLRWDHVVEKPGYHTIRYHGVTLKKGDPTTCVMQILDRQRVRTIAEASSPGPAVPYILHSGSFWYVADSPFSYAEDQDRYWAFADVLHDIVGIAHKQEHRALIRIEDITPMADVHDLHEVADRLHALKTPFLVALVPKFVDPWEHTSIVMSSKRSFVDAIRYMCARGGSIVMHGYDHRYRGRSGADFEFWDDDHSAPIREDSTLYVRKHITWGLNVCFDSGVYPLAWETPHYAASMQDYQEIARHFTTGVEQKVLLNQYDFGQFYPFFLSRDIFGQKIYPENLGYVEFQQKAGAPEGDEDVGKESRDVERMLANARAARVLRDANVGAFFHPFLDPNLLTRLVTGLHQLGYTFLDLRQQTNRVQADDMLIASGRTSGQVILHNQYLHESYLDETGRVRHDYFSSRKMTGLVRRKVDCPPGWIYICRGAGTRPPSWWAVTRRRLLARLRKSQAQDAVPTIAMARAALVTNPNAQRALATDQRSFARALASAGYAPTQLPVDSLDEETLSAYNLVAIPQAAAGALTSDQAAALVEKIKGGLNVLLDGYSPLSHELGVHDDRAERTVNGVQAMLSDEPMFWRQPERLRLPVFPSGATVVYRFDKQPIGAWFRLGKGRVLALAPLFDPDTGLGYGRFPTLPTALAASFPLQAPVVAKDLEVFFEPGLRPNRSIERLVVQWKEWGVRVVHAATWHFYPSWRYDYARLIKNCHENGIAVYAWLELPHVTAEFYKQHPRWREKTATGADAMAGWRAPMALEVPACRKAVLDWVSEMLERYDWDGVNLAELCFDNEKGPDKPEQFLPMHPYFRKAFQARCGWDPVEVCKPGSAHYFKTNPAAWEQFARYRAETLCAIYKEVLASFRHFQEGDERTGRKEVIVTSFDTLDAPEITRNTGLDVMQVIGMMAAGNAPGLPPRERFDFTLSVEDPQRFWNLPPDRYLGIGARYQKLVRNPSRLALDLNVVECHRPPQEGFAARSPMGVETLEMLRCARAAASRVILYCEKTLEDDAPFLGAASAASGTWRPTEGECNLQSRGTVFLRGQENDDAASIDGVRTGVDHLGAVAVPAGTHQVRTRESLVGMATSDVPVIRLLNCTGDLRRLESSADSLLVDYEATGPCLISTDQEPQEMLLDGKPQRFEALAGTECWSVQCPSGRHRVRLTGKDRALFEVQVATAVSSHSIVLFGGGGAALLLMLVSLTHVERRLRRRTDRRKR